MWMESCDLVRGDSGWRMGMFDVDVNAPSEAVVYWDVHDLVRFKRAENQDGVAF